MKNLIIFSLIVVLLSACGALRPGSMNEKDDQYNRRLKNSVDYDSAKKSQDVRDKDIELDAKAKALKANGNLSSNDNKNVSGLAVNRYNKRQVKYEFWLGSRQVKGITLASKQEQPVSLPVGVYLVKYYESKYKGQFLIWSKKLEINNLSLEEKNGAKFNFIVSN